MNADISTATSIYININVFSLPPGGALLLFDKLLNETRDGPLMSTTWNLVMAAHFEGGLRTQTDFEKVLTENGFRNVKVQRMSDLCPYDVLYAQKV